MNTKEAPQQSDSPSKAKRPKVKILRRVFRPVNKVLNKIPPLRFAKNLVQDRPFWTQVGGVSNGGTLIAQGVAGMFFILSLPFILQPLGGVVCCALVGAGLYGIRYGLARAWMTLENVCSKSFRTFNPLKALRGRAQSFARNISGSAPMQGLRSRMGKVTGKLAQSPRLKRMAQRPLVQKFLNSRILRSRHGLTPEQQNVFLAGLTIEGSLAMIAVSAAGVASHIAVATSLPLSGALAIGAVAAYWIGSCVFDIYCSARCLSQSYRDKKNGKNSAIKGPAPESAITAITPQTPKTGLLSVNTTPAFNKKAAWEAPKETTLSRQSSVRGLSLSSLRR